MDGSTRRIGYIRTSPGDSPDAPPQLEGLELDQLFIDEDIAPRTVGRPQRAALMAALRPGDVLVVESLNRLASLGQLREILRTLAGRGISIELRAEGVTLASALDGDPERDFALIAAGLALVEESLAERREAARMQAFQPRPRGRAVKLDKAQLEALLNRCRAIGNGSTDSLRRIALDFGVSTVTVINYAKAANLPPLPKKRRTTTSDR